MASDVILSECDQSGKLLGTVLQSSDGGCHLKRAGARKSVWQQTLDVFLPAGYPQSVSQDYLKYQTFDSLQAFSSSIAGMLASRAVLEGVGVGDASAQPTTALLLSVLHESCGRLATILCAHRLGSALAPECKMYRLAADVCNDAAVLLDCLSPALPRPARVAVFSVASVMRALCGVAAGSSKATLSAHFAKWDNLGDVNAKDSSQETVIALLGMLTGSIVVSWVTDPLTTWITLLVLLCIHLSMNYAAVKAVRMTTLNRQRANIVFSSIVEHDKVLGPDEVSRVERIFERDGVLRLSDGSITGYANIGVGASSFMRALTLLSTSEAPEPWTATRDAIQLFDKQAYLLTVDNSQYKPTINIALKQHCTAAQQLKAWFHAWLVAQASNETTRSTVLSHQDLRRRVNDSAHSTTDTSLAATLARIDMLWDRYEVQLQAAGWNLDIGSLETHLGTRVFLGSKKDA